MIQLEIPNFKNLCIQNLVLDFNGTISRDGELLLGVADKLEALKELLVVHVITSDTHGNVNSQVGGLAQVTILQSSNHTLEKQDFVKGLGAESVIAIGNGRNDVGMLSSAAVGIAVCQEEGASVEALRVADVQCKDILDGLDFLLHPKRMLATLRG